MSEVLHKLLVRVCDMRMNEQVGLLIEDAVRRPVWFRINRGGLDPSTATLDGLVLIGPDQGPNGVEDLRRHVGECLVKCLTTDEVWWVPLNAYRDGPTGWWSVECVPLVAYTRLSSRSDEFILKQSGYDPVTREQRPSGWMCGQCGEPNKSEWPACHNCGRQRVAK